MVIVLVLEEQFSHRQRADHCKATNLQEQVFLESGKSVLGIHVSQGYLGGIGTSTSLGLLTDYFFSHTEVTRRDIHIFFRCQVGSFHLTQDDPFDFLPQQLAKAPHCLQKKIQRLYPSIHDY